MASRTPPGVRELKLHISLHKLYLYRRTPPGVRELKLSLAVVYHNQWLSHPSRGA